MLTQNKPQPYFTGEAKPDAITENSTQYYLYHRVADDSLTGNVAQKAPSFARLFAVELKQHHCCIEISDATH